MLVRLQRGLEALYRVDTHLDVRAFMVGREQQRHAAEKIEDQGQTARLPREQLLLSQQDEELSMGLFLDRGAIANLERHDPARGLSEVNFGDFCLAVEGVSHFIYVAVRAANDRPVSALELELQAEIDKFVSCLLVENQMPRQSDDLRRRLYDGTALADDLEAGERARYQRANDEARRYARALDRRFIRPGRVTDMLAELRRFYRLGLGEKLDAITKAAA